MLKDKKLSKEEAKTMIRNSKRNVSPHMVTRVYRAPEVCLADKDYDSAIDIWSTGCVLYELMLCVAAKNKY